VQFRLRRVHFFFAKKKKPNQRKIRPTIVECDTRSL